MHDSDWLRQSTRAGFGLGMNSFLFFLFFNVFLFFYNDCYGCLGASKHEFNFGTPHRESNVNGDYIEFFFFWSRQWQCLLAVSGSRVFGWSDKCVSLRTKGCCDDGT